MWSKEKKIRLLAYASVCLTNGVNPFHPKHLFKMGLNQSKRHINDLSALIAGAIDEEVLKRTKDAGLEYASFYVEARKTFKEAQQ